MVLMRKEDEISPLSSDDTVRSPTISQAPTGDHTMDLECTQ